MTSTKKINPRKRLVPALLFIGLLCLVALVNVTLYNPQNHGPEGEEEDLIAMRDRDAELPTLFDINQADVRDAERRPYKYTDPNYYQGRPNPR